jgi:hypothetical protein
MVVFAMDFIATSLLLYSSLLFPLLSSLFFSLYSLSLHLYYCMSPLPVARVAPDEDTLAGKGQMRPRDGIAVP